MPRPSIVLDTCALRDTKFTNWLKGYIGDILIPPTVYMEICRQHKEKNHSIEELDEWLNALSIKVLRFDKNNARIAAELMAERKDAQCEICKKIDWVDTIVASYYNAGDFIITNDKTGFPTSGDFGWKFLTTDEFMSR
ncbi:hypothetical protein Mpt1_c09670 [Candidatus Methanoplasma termitum]|uniref:PIN domain-containing protein n=1 Tax=Candidatus Methanoplasma termitum TaxID=1577791 RepID=A0A0A7LET7_9ARCH|nr:type II toxin-antitoxin system VapC family toxin [Candidatus Methanoplasma termitum]AIZ56842.1 hypothetical protein Mpt1_c09670 [Candidatus Methanoplasma termitum]